MKIKDQVALVSGGASGMGYAVAEYLTKQQATVIVLDRNESLAHQVAEKFHSIPLVCDVTDGTALEKAINTLSSDMKSKLKVVVNCAGVAPAKRMVGKQGPVDLDWFQNVININLIGTFNVMRIAANIMIEQATDEKENGVIINTASVAAFDGQVGQSAYSASKGGVVSMTLPLARELAQFKIRVMCIAPGLIKTPMLEQMPENVTQALIAQTVHPKRFGLPEEFALLVNHIIENPMLNGEVIRLDGALRMVG